MVRYDLLFDKVVNGLSTMLCSLFMSYWRQIGLNQDFREEKKLLLKMSLQKKVTWHILTFVSEICLNHLQK